MPTSSRRFFRRIAPARPRAPGSPARLHEVNVANAGLPVSARRTDVITHPTMNRASGTRGRRYFKRNADKTLDGQTLAAAAAPAEFPERREFRAASPRKH
jgi:hypothetical protein